MVQRPSGGKSLLQRNNEQAEALGLRPPSEVFSQEASMHMRVVLTTLVGTAVASMITLATMTAPAMAAWRSYISHPMGFAFAAPGELKIDKGTYRGAVAGARETSVYRFLDDDIEYKVEVIDMTDKANDSATLLGEAAYIFQENKKLFMDVFG